MKQGPTVPPVVRWGPTGPRKCTVNVLKMAQFLDQKWGPGAHEAHPGDPGCHQLIKVKRLFSPFRHISFFTLIQLVCNSIETHQLIFSPFQLSTLAAGGPPADGFFKANSVCAAPWDHRGALPFALEADAGFPPGASLGFPGGTNAPRTMRVGALPEPETGPESVRPAMTRARPRQREEKGAASSSSRRIERDTPPAHPILRLLYLLLSYHLSHPDRVSAEPTTPRNKPRLLRRRRPALARKSLAMPRPLPPGSALRTLTWGRGRSPVGVRRRRCSPEESPRPAGAGKGPL